GLTPGTATSNRKTEWSSKFPPGQFVAALVPLAMSSYRNRSYTPIATYIQEELLCHIAMKATSRDPSGRKRARLVIKGLQAEVAWRHFVRETNKLAKQGLLADLEDDKVAWHSCPPAQRVLEEEDDAAAEEEAEEEKNKDDDSVDWGGSEESLSEAEGHAEPDDVEQDEASDGLTSDEEAQEDAATTAPAPPKTRWERLRDLAFSQIEAARDENGLSQEAVNLVRSVPAAEPLPRVALNLRISCCVACFARGWQLRKALAANILLQRSHSQNVRFCISLYDDAGNDGKETRDFIEENFQEELASGFLVVRFSSDLQHFHSSVCKNAAHKLALLVPWGQGFVSSDGLTSLDTDWTRKPKTWADVAPATAGGTDTRRHILINVDADNILSGNFVGLVANNNQVYAGITSEPAQIFGFRCDIDFFQRVKHKAPGWAYRLSFHRGWSIPNDRDEKVAFSTAKSKHAGCHLAWSMQNAKNRDVSKQQLLDERWFRNTDRIPEASKALLLLKDLGGPDFSSCSLLAAGRIRDGLTSQIKKELTSEVSSSSGLTGENPAKTREVDEAMAMEVDQVPEPVQARKEEVDAPMESADEPATAKPRRADGPTAGMVLPPNRNRVYVDIVTCGAANLQFTLGPASGRNKLPKALFQKCKAMRLRATAQGERTVDQNLLVDMLREVDLFPRDSTEHVVLDTRVFHDPFSSNTLRDHVGYHPEVMRMVSESKPNWFHFLVRFVRRAVRLASEADVPAGQRRSVAVLCFCKSGNHRSVAMAYLLQHALQHSSLIEAVQCAHVTEMAGNWADRQCGPCDICRGQPDQANTAHDDMVRQAKHRARSAWQHAFQSA
ncbi:unnamed protein product, partial [Symbiodinium sp. CCMP2456]